MLSTIKLTISCCLVIIIFSSCQEDHIREKQKEQLIQFSLAPLDLSDNGRIENLDHAYAVIISVRNGSGKIVMDQDTIDLYDVQGRFISAPMSFNPGNYTLTGFNVIDKDGNLLYLAPKEDADRAYLVPDPLPMPFEVYEEEMNQKTIIIIPGES